MENKWTTVQQAPQFVCYNCGLLANEQSRLQEHTCNITIPQIVDILISCRNCSLCCSKNQSIHEYISHNLYMHGTISAFECGQCREKYVTQVSLDIHKLYH